MASIFGHALAATTIGKVYQSKTEGWKFYLLGIVCAILPDADVVGFKFGIAYESFWGHRGFSHSLLFALLLAVFVVLVFFKKSGGQQKLLLVSYYFLCTASHAVLDAMTSGGLGVAFFSPWEDSRYFFPFRPIKVSPIGIKQFFSTWGIKVLVSELVWIGIPTLTFLTCKVLMQKLVLYFIEKKEG